MASHDQDEGNTPVDETHEAPSRMKSVNVLLTQEMLNRIDRINPNSRSDAVRTVIAAILEANDDGVPGPLSDAVKAARCTSARSRKQMSGQRIAWLKSIIWIPEDLHNILNHISARHETTEDRVRVADLIRGCVIFISEQDPYGNINADA
ncbi:MAG: hypothetical protein ABJN42_07670 [Roseibium sp.]|uniref:hypothetical protein n=1 Tax=Roseibium sp. TaxID=1936156 RepID=UPI003298CE83